MVPHGKIRSVKELGALVRQRRKDAGVLQADAAALAGVGARFLSELERGKETAEVGKVLQVLDRLGLELLVVPRGSGEAASPAQERDDG
jgi:y4mF family transcriptional regulator